MSDKQTELEQSLASVTLITKQYHSAGMQIEAAERYAAELHRRTIERDYHKRATDILADNLKRVKNAMAWMEERARNSTSFGSHCHAYEVAARHLKLALDGDDVAPSPQESAP